MTPTPPFRSEVGAFQGGGVHNERSLSITSRTNTTHIVSYTNAVNEERNRPRMRQTKYTVSNLLSYIALKNSGADASILAYFSAMIETSAHAAQLCKNFHKKNGLLLGFGVSEIHVEWTY